LGGVGGREGRLFGEQLEGGSIGGRKEELRGFYGKEREGESKLTSFLSFAADLSLLFSLSSLRAMSVFRTMDSLGYTTILSANLNQTISHHHLFAPWVKGEQPNQPSFSSVARSKLTSLSFPGPYLLPQSSSSKQKTPLNASNLHPASSSLPTTL